MTHWWEFFREGEPDRPFIQVLHKTAQFLAETPGVKLVVGHSNTTDALAALIGADPGPPIDDAAEFDRLYVITITDGYQVASQIERYGAPSPVGAENSP